MWRKKNTVQEGRGNVFQVAEGPGSFLSAPPATTEADARNWPRRFVWQTSSDGEKYRGGLRDVTLSELDVSDWLAVGDPILSNRIFFFFSFLFFVLSSRSSSVDWGS